MYKLPEIEAVLNGADTSQLAQQYRALPNDQLRLLITFSHLQATTKVDCRGMMPAVPPMPKEWVDYPDSHQFFKSMRVVLARYGRL